jgi:hypothetical protein
VTTASDDEDALPFHRGLEYDRMGPSSFTETAFAGMTTRSHRRFRGPDTCLLTLGLALLAAVAVLVACGGESHSVKNTGTPITTVRRYVRAVAAGDNDTACALSASDWKQGCPGHPIEDGDQGEAEAAVEYRLRFTSTRSGDSAEVTARCRTYRADWQLSRQSDGWRVSGWTSRRSAGRQGAQPCPS